MEGIRFSHHAAPVSDFYQDSSSFDLSHHAGPVDDRYDDQYDDKYDDTGYREQGDFLIHADDVFSKVEEAATSSAHLAVPVASDPYDSDAESSHAHSRSPPSDARTLAGGSNGNPSHQTLQLVDQEPQSRRRGPARSGLPRLHDPSPLPDWLPPSVKLMSSLCFILLLHLILYIIFFAYSQKYAIVAPRGANVDWLFRFGPSFIAVLINELCQRLSVDVHTIAPYINIQQQPHRRKRFWNRLHSGKDSLTQPPFPKSLWPLSKLDSLAYLASILVLIQSTIFQSGGRVIQSNGYVYQTPSLADFIPAFQSSYLPAEGIQGFFSNQSISDYRWSTGDLLDNGELQQVGILPFRPKNQDYSIVTQSMAASGFMSTFTCTEVDEFQVTIAPSGKLYWNVGLNLTTNNGCSYQHTWPNVPLVGDVDYGNGVVSNKTFAMWRTLDDGDLSITNSGNCSPYKHFLAYGTFTDAQLASTKQASVPTGSGTGWAAVSCDSDYLFFNSTLPMSFSSSSQNIDDLEPDPSTAVHLDGSVAAFQFAMKQNFIDNSLVYRMGDYFDSKTFYNQTAQNVWGGGDSGPDYTNSPACNGFANPLACGMYMRAQGIWAYLFALSVPTVAQYMPSDQWVDNPGSATWIMIGWYVPTGSFVLLVLVTVGLIMATVLCDLFALPSWLPYRFQKPHNFRTALSANPSTLIGKISLFIDDQARGLFRGLDGFEAKEAAKRTRNRLRQVRLDFASAEESGGVSIKGEIMGEDYRIISDKSADAAGFSDHQLSEDLSQVHRLRFGFIPWMFNPFLLTFVFAALISLTAVILKYLMTRSFPTFALWYQLATTTGSPLRSDFLHWLHAFLLSIVPPLILLILRFWWTQIDTFYRQVQPYASLYPHGKGKTTIGLEYMNDPDILVTAKAVEHKHWKLVFITTVTLAVKVALIFAGGLVTVEDIVSTSNLSASFIQNWRGSTFASDLGKITSQVRSLALSRAFTDYTGDTGWLQAPYMFPSAQAQSPIFTMTLPGLTANMSCQQAPVAFTLNATTGLQDAELWGPICAKAKWDGLCISDNSFVEPGNATSTSETRGTVNGSCTGWSYLTPDSCYETSSGGGGQWWLLSVQGQVNVTNTTGVTTATGLHSVQSNTSLICEVLYFEDSINTTVVTDGDGQPQLSVNAIVSSTQLPANHWLTDATDHNDQSQTFDQYFAGQVMSSDMANKLRQVSQGVFMDDMSIIAAANSSQTVGAFSNSTEFARIASNAFSNVFATVVSGKALNTNGSTFLLQTADGSPNQSGAGAQAQAVVERAVVAKVPLAIVTAVLLLYAASLALVYPDESRRIPFDPAWPANHVVAFYDSYLVDTVRACLLAGSDPHLLLADQYFGYGVCEGISGRRRLAVDILARITQPRRPTDSWWERWWERANGRAGIVSKVGGVGGAGGGGGDREFDIGAASDPPKGIVSMVTDTAYDPGVDATAAPPIPRKSTMIVQYG